jgi:hypothetical protein
MVDDMRHRSDRNPARSSDANSSGCSQAASACIGNGRMAEAPAALSVVVDICISFVVKRVT